MFLRLCTRAPCTAIVVRADRAGGVTDSSPRRLDFDASPAAFRGCLSVGEAAFFPVPFPTDSEAIGRLRRGEECQLLDLNVALLRELDGRRGSADQPLV